MKKITVSTKERRFIIVFMIINCIALFVNVFEFNSFKDFYKDRYYYFTDNGKFDAVDINKTYFGPTKTSKDFFYPFIDFTESTFSTTANINYIIGREIIKNRKRTDAVIAIIRDIEKNQTLPTIGMMQALFNQELDNDGEEDDFLEDMIEKNPPKPYPKYEGEVVVPRIKYEHLEEKAASLQTDLKDILDKVKVVKGSFGKSYLKLEITEGRLERYKLEANRPLDSLY